MLTLVVGRQHLRCSVRTVPASCAIIIYIGLRFVSSTLPLHLDITDFLLLPQLYGTNQTSIVAHWKPQTESSPLTLIISPGVERSHAQIIAAFLYAEQKMRSMEQTGRLGVQTLTAVQIAQSSTVVTGMPV